MLKRSLLTGLILALLASLWVFAPRPQPDETPALNLAADEDTSGFARAYEPIDFVFPRDHGPHFDYQTEWWYYTGNLQSADGQHYAYQLTFFRRGITPGAPPSAQSGLATNQIYFAHFAITDVPNNRHSETERFSRGAGGLSGAQGEPFKVWLEDWSSLSLNAEGSAVHLQARDAAVGALDLTLRAVKPVVKQGIDGLSQKSEVSGNASYYISFTRMVTEGQLTLNGQTLSVIGESWFDHEWSTSGLGQNVIGWNWFSLQLDDGRDLMFYQFRMADGSIGPLTAGTLVEVDGSTRYLTVGDVQIVSSGSWRSAETEAEYPARWQVSIPSAQIELSLEPYVADQEMNVSSIYWEGAVKLSGTSNGASVLGNGFVELTGYKGELNF